MNKEEFLSRLNALLSELSDADREEAIQYYRDYLEEAGPEKEEETIQSFGSPEEVAKNIMEENAEGSFTESGFTKSVSQQNPIMKVSEERNQNNTYENKGSYYDGAGFGSIGNNGTAGQNSGNQSEKKDDSTNMIIAIVLAVVLSPFWIPILGSIISGIVAAAGAFIGLAVSGGIMLILSVIFLVGGIATVFATPALGSIIIGLAFVMAALGILFILLTGVIIKYLIPFLWGLVKKFWNFIFHKKEGENA